MSQVLTETVNFLQVHGKPGVIETKLPPNPTIGDLVEALKIAGTAVDKDALVFLDEDEESLGHDQKAPLRSLKPGSRIHVSTCRRIRTTVHFLEKTAHRDFAPGVRVRAVKAWAVREFKLEPKDAGEHVLRVCNSTTIPATDTPLHELAERGQCSVCFDLVPDKRVEG